MAKTKIELVEQFCCPGCVAGSDTSCGSYEPSTYGAGCDNHAAGTLMMPGGKIALGLPKGFNRVGATLGKRDGFYSESNIRCWPKGDAPDWDHLNVPVWAME